MDAFANKTGVQNTSPVENKPQQTSSTFDKAVVSICVFLILFLAPFDTILSITRIGFFLSTGFVLSVVVIIFSIVRILRLLNKTPMGWLVLSIGFCFLPGTYIISFSHSLELNAVISYLGLWLGYGLLALAIAGWSDTIYFYPVISRAIVYSVILVSALALIDLYLNIDIPYFNDEIGSELLLSLRGINGPFSSRSQAAIVMEGMVAFTITNTLLSNKFISRLVSGLAAVLGLIFMLHTGNTSFFMAIGTVILALIWYSGRKLAHKIAYAIILIMLVLFILNILSLVAPEYFDSYRERLLSIISSRGLNESDEVRIKIFQYTVDSLVNKNIFGNGPTRVPFETFGRNAINPHSIITSLLWSGGLFGLLWLIFFIISTTHNYFKLLATPYRKEAILFTMPILAQLVGGLTHSSLGNLNLWVFIGLFVGLVYTSYQLKKSWHF